MVTISLNRYRIDGSGLIKFPDGRSGRVRVVLDERLEGESRIAGRPDLIKAAVADGIANISLGDGGGSIFVNVSPRDIRRAAIKPMTVPGLDNESDTASLYFNAKVTIIVGTEIAGQAVLELREFNGALPEHAELLGDPALLNDVHDYGAVTIEFCGLSVDAVIFGWNQETGKLHIMAEPIFAALGRHAARSQKAL